MEPFQKSKLIIIRYQRQDLVFSILMAPSCDIPSVARVLLRVQRDAKYIRIADIIVTVLIVTKFTPNENLP